jgi:hypothetical protein
MCVSAQASFIVGAGTGAVGLATFKRAYSTPRQWLALAPCLFGLQQASEGAVWLHLNGGFHATPLGRIAQYTYLMFALVFWPSYAPFAVAMSEEMKFRRILCWLAVAAGVLVSAFNMFQLVTGSNLPTVVGHSIRYGYAEGYFPSRLTYGIAAMMPLFISSLRKMWLLGAVALFGFAVSDRLYYEAFVSVWCFFAAIVSILVYFILKANEKFAV